MAKINTLTVEGNKSKGFTVTAMTDEGLVIDIAEGFEFKTLDEFNAICIDIEKQNGDLNRMQTERDEARTQIEQLQAEAKALSERPDAPIGGEQVDEQIVMLNAEIVNLRRQLDDALSDVRVPLLHVEHQDIPTARTVDKLAPLGALAAAPTIDEPPVNPLLDPDAPARPPGPGELVKVHGEYRGREGYQPAFTNNEINE